MNEKKIFEVMPELAIYMQSVILQLEKDKKYSAVHTYTYTLKSLTKFYGGKNSFMPVDEVFTPGRLKEYEEWMRQEGMKNKEERPRGLSLNTISTYMRTLRAIYNRLTEENVLPYNPKLFDNVYTKVESQTKRALRKEQMSVLLCADFEKLPQETQCALAYFLLMFLFRGMPFIDLAYLRKQDVKGDKIVYSRHKTGRQITVRIPKEATKLMKEFANSNSESIYLFPILNKQTQRNNEQYSNYQRALRRFNKQLETVSSLLLPDTRLSSYTSRHTWATLAFHAGVNIGIISKALGHSGIKVTETYLRPFENERVDFINDELICSVTKCHHCKRNRQKEATGNWNKERVLLTK